MNPIEEPVVSKQTSLSQDPQLNTTGPGKGKVRLLKDKSLIIFFVLAAFLTVYFFWDIQNLPFHPDESTYLFMSSDFEALFTHPLSLAWNPKQENDLKQRYHELDAPLTRYILGAGRAVAGLTALKADWSWDKTWQENRRAGAIPSPQLLTAGRATVTLLLPLSLLFLYLVGRAIGSRFTGLLAAFLLGTNALVLLHDRRAMAEGVLTLGVAFAVWSFIQGDKRPWLAGIGLAIAFNSKQSALALLPVGLLAVCWSGLDQPGHWKRLALALTEYLGIFLLLTVLLNPFLWSNPIQAAKAAWQRRLTLQNNQEEAWVGLARGQLLETPAQRAAGLLANLYMTPPAFAEVPNYHPQTAADEQAYLRTPGHNLFRGLIAGGVELMLTLAGFILAAISLRRLMPEQRRALSLVLLATVFQVAAIALLTPLPWQRYVVPVVPFVCLLCAYCLSTLAIIALRSRSRASVILQE